MLQNYYVLELGMWLSGRGLAQHILGPGSNPQHHKQQQKQQIKKTNQIKNITFCSVLALKIERYKETCILVGFSYSMAKRSLASHPEALRNYFLV